MTTRTNATSQVYWAFAHRFWKCAQCNNQWDSVLLSSRDGLNFTFVGNREPWVRPGPDGGAGSRMIHVMPTPIEVGDELFVYVAMTDENHAGAVDPASPGGKKQTAVVLFRLRKDGLVIPTQLRSRLLSSEPQQGSCWGQVSLDAPLFPALCPAGRPATLTTKAVPLGVGSPIVRANAVCSGGGVMRAALINAATRATVTGTRPLQRTI